MSKGRKTSPSGKELEAEMRRDEESSLDLSIAHDLLDLSAGESERFAEHDGRLGRDLGEELGPSPKEDEMICWVKASFP